MVPNGFINQYVSVNGPNLIITHTIPQIINFSVMAEITYVGFENRGWINFDVDFRTCYL